MGSDTGFLDFKRKDQGYRPAEERLKDFREVENLPDKDNVYNQAARCMDCGTPFCHGKVGCTLSNIIPEFNDLVYRGEWQMALDILLETCSFPEFTGRICPALCEAACVNGINNEPVTIRQIELAIIEEGFKNGLMCPRPPEKYYDKRVAVIGAGPSGLAAADYLNRAGYRVTVYDAAEKPGGLLRYGIPDFKLDKSIVDRRIQLMKEEGIIFEKNVSVGIDVSAKYLRTRYDAICLSCGARKPRDLQIPGRNLTGIFFAMDYLTQQNKKIGGEKIPPSTEINASGKSVVVIGGGDTGSDCLGTALRQGAKSVIQLEILPKPPLERADDTPWPMWPNKLRESHAHKEGGIRRWAVTATEFAGENGILKKLLCTKVQWINKGKGSFPENIKGTEFELDVDLVFLAMGFVGPGNETLIKEFDVETDSLENVKADENMMTDIKGVFASGDINSGQSLVVKAINSGKLAAKGIIKFLSEK